MAFDTAAAYASGFDSGKYGFKTLGEAKLLSESGKDLAASVQAANQALAGNLALKALGIEGDLKEREMVNEVLMATLNETAKQKKNQMLINLMSGGTQSSGMSGIDNILGSYQSIAGKLPGAAYVLEPEKVLNEVYSQDMFEDTSPYSVKVQEKKKPSLQDLEYQKLLLNKKTK